MLPGVLNLEVTAGDGYRLSLTFKNDDDEIIDVSGFTFHSQIRKTAKSETAIDFAIDDTDAAIGIIVMTLTGAQVRSAGVGISQWDMEYCIDKGDPQTVLKGTFKVLADITRIET